MTSQMVNVTNTSTTRQTANSALQAVVVLQENVQKVFPTKEILSVSVTSCLSSFIGTSTSVTFSGIQ